MRREDASGRCSGSLFVISNIISTLNTDNTPVIMYKKNSDLALDE